MSNPLEQQLREAKIPVRVEPHDRLAILVPDRAWTGGADERARVIEMARSAGFSHVAVEIDPPDAPLSGD